MADKFIQLHDQQNNLLFPRTYWRAILDAPSVASLDDLATKQDQLTAANSGPGISIETTTGGVLKISATQTSNYNVLLNKPSVNGITLQGTLSLADLGISWINSTDDAAFEIADDIGNVALRVTNQGHLETKLFNSEDLPTRLGQFINDMGYITIQNVSDFVNDYKTNILDPTYVAQADFISTLDAALNNGLNPRFGVLRFSNDANYLTATSLQTKIVAGTNISITTSGDVMTINSTASGGSGTTNYNELSNRPTLGGHLLAGAMTYEYLNLPYVELTPDAAYQVTDDIGNVVLRVTNQGHIVSQQFNSENLPTDLSQFTNNPGYLTNASLVNITTPLKWGNHPYPNTGVNDTYILGTNDVQNDPVWVSKTTLLQGIQSQITSISNTKVEASAVTINLTGWITSGSTASCTVQVSGVTATNTVLVTAHPNYADIFAQHNIRCVGQAANQLSFSSEGDPGTVQTNILIMNNVQ